MRTLFVILLLLVGPVLAQETVGDVIKDSVLRVVEDDCETEVRRARMYTTISLETAKKGDWTMSFRYMDEAFFSLLRADSYCEGNEEKLTEVEQYLGEHKDISQRLECSFHSLEARREFSMGKMAIEHFDNYENALFHTNWGIYYVEEALQRCEFDPERVKMLEEVQKEMYTAVQIIRETVDERRGDL